MPNEEDIKKTSIIEVIGDSLLNNINPRGISKKGDVKILNHPGATSQDMKDFINPSINRKPDMLICHVGTNDITNNIDTLTNLQTIINRIKKKSASTKIVFSSVIQRHDQPHIEKKVSALNNELKQLCDENQVH